MRWSLVLLAVTGCPKKPILYDGGTIVMPGARPPVVPADPAAVAMVSDALVLACRVTAGPAAGAECELPACRDGVCPELAALGVGVQRIEAGLVSIPIGRVSLVYSDDACGLFATSTEAEARWWEPGRPITAVALADAAAYGPDGFVAVEAFAVDLDGDAVDEWVVDGEVGEDRVVGVVAGGSWAEVFYEDGWSATLLGLTDEGLDGDLELVFSADGYEAWGYTVGAVASGRFEVSGSIGCAH